MGGSFTEEFGDVAGGVGSFLQGAWDTASEVGEGVMAGVQHPAGNPWFQGLAAVIAVGLAFAFGPKLLSNIPGFGSDSLAGRGMRGMASLALAAGLGMSAAAGVGMLRDDGPGNESGRPRVEASATDDASLAQPARPGLHG